MRRSVPRWLVTIGACLAIVAQLTVAFASLADARDQQSTRAHVEQSGTSQHYAHNDACGLCQARSLHGLTVRAAAPIPSAHVQSTAIIAVADRLIVADLDSSRSSRAPPSQS